MLKFNAYLSLFGARMVLYFPKKFLIVNRFLLAASCLSLRPANLIFSCQKACCNASYYKVPSQMQQVDLERMKFAAVAIPPVPLTDVAIQE